MGYLYEHHAKYYETDQMGIIHHSNYIRWMEEARSEFMKDSGFSYKTMEEYGIISPVLEVHCEYKSMTRFDDTVVIEISITKYTGIKMFVEYIISDKNTGEVRAVANSAHCFLDRNNKPVSLKKQCPAAHEMFQSQLEKL